MFHYPPLYQKKTAIVITPTISLMTDQVNKLTKRGILATLIGSAQKEDVMHEIEDGKYSLVYTTPESFYCKSTNKPNKIFLKMAEEKRLSLLAMDEAHLIFTLKSFRYVNITITKSALIAFI